MLAPSSYPKSTNIQMNSITTCNCCDIYKNYLVAERKLTSKGKTDKTYFITGDLSCNSKNVIYLITRGKCKDEYIGAALSFKPCFRVHKTDIKTKKERSGPSTLSSTSHFGYVRGKITEQVDSEDSSKIEELLWYREIVAKSAIHSYS